jgi:hypothetical protein
VPSTRQASPSGSGVDDLASYALVLNSSVHPQDEKLFSFV